MANIVDLQTIVDGPRNLVVKATLILDTADLTSTIVVDPTGGQFPVSKVRLDKLTYAIEDALAVNVYWDATTAKLIGSFTGRSKIGGWTFGGLQNDAGAGVTGKIAITTQGWSTSAILSATLLFECTKQP